MAVSFTYIWESSFGLSFFSDPKEAAIDLVLTRIQSCKTHNMGKPNYGNKNQACIIPLKTVTAPHTSWYFFYHSYVH